MKRKNSRSRRARRKNNPISVQDGIDGSSRIYQVFNPLPYIKSVAMSYLLVGSSFVFLVLPFTNTALGEFEKPVELAGFCLDNDLSFGANPFTVKDAEPEIKKVGKTDTMVSKHPVLYKKIISIVKNTPMEKMALDISNGDTETAAFLVGIAMKESKFGIYSPKKNGRDCYNYWGYRGRENPTASGYSCFSSREQAVKVVGNRIHELIGRGANTPSRMTIWKCGSSCEGHSRESVRKWIADVSIHYHQLRAVSEIAKN